MNGRTGLYRSNSDQMIGGVAGGMAAYLRIDSSLVRLLFVLLVLAGGSGVLLYVILWIVLPLDANEIINENNHTMEDKKAEEKQQRQNLDAFGRYKKKDDGSLIAGLILIALGVIFLVIRYFPRIDFGDLWPIILIIVGIVLLRDAFKAKKE